MLPPPGQLHLADRNLRMGCALIAPFIRRCCYSRKLTTCKPLCLCELIALFNQRSECVRPSARWCCRPKKATRPDTINQWSTAESPAIHVIPERGSCRAAHASESHLHIANPLLTSQQIHGAYHYLIVPLMTRLILAFETVSLFGKLKICIRVLAATSGQRPTDCGAFRIEIFPSFSLVHCTRTSSTWGSAAKQVYGVASDGSCSWWNFAGESLAFETTRCARA